MIIVYAAFGVAVFLLLFTLVLSYLAYRKIFYSDRRKKRDPYSGIDKRGFKPYAQRIKGMIDANVAAPYESVEITSRDGLKLFARYYHKLDGAPIEIQCHGYRSNSLRDFASNGDEKFARPHNILLIDHRAHGESEGKTISFGILERFDIIDWINYLISRFGKETSIFLYGISMGAATVLMAVGEDLPECVKGVVADCPYSAPIDIIVKVGREMGLPGFLVKPLAIAGARVYGGFSLTSCDPISAVRRAKIPILLIHGELDTFVPEYMSEKISKQNTKIIYKKFAEADHAASYLCDTDAYVSLVNGFLYENI